MIRFGLLVILAVSQLISYASAKGSCMASGDPHYKTFDGYRYDFQGGCRYVHTTDSCKSLESREKMKLARFKVIADNVGSGVTMVKNVEVYIDGKVIHLSRSNQPAPHTTREYVLTHENNKIVIRSISPPGITVLWNKHTTLEIRLDEKYRGKVCGLCGNFDGNPSNEWITSTGSIANSIYAWANSWRAGGQCGVPAPPAHPCEQHPNRRIEALKDCAVIRSPLFASCKLILEPLYHNCVYDVCAMGMQNAVASSCEAISTASIECAEINPNIKLDWGHLKQKCRCKTMAQMEPDKKCCTFPFKYQGRYHYKCIDPKNAVGRSRIPFKRPWCSTVDDLDNHDRFLNYVGPCVKGGL